MGLPLLSFTVTVPPPAACSERKTVRLLCGSGGRAACCAATRRGQKQRNEAQGTGALLEPHPQSVWSVRIGSAGLREAELRAGDDGVPTGEDG